MSKPFFLCAVKYCIHKICYAHTRYRKCNRIKKFFGENTLPKWILKARHSHTHTDIKRVRSHHTDATKRRRQQLKLCGATQREYAAAACEQCGHKSSASSVNDDASDCG